MIHKLKRERERDLSSFVQQEDLENQLKWAVSSRCLCGTTVYHDIVRRVSVESM